MGNITTSMDTELILRIEQLSEELECSKSNVVAKAVNLYSKIYNPDPLEWVEVLILLRSILAQQGKKITWTVTNQ